MSNEELTPREQEEIENLDGDERRIEVEKLLKQREKRVQEEKRRADMREESKGMVLTDIDLPFGRVFWVTVQFFVAGLVLAIPIWLIIFYIYLKVS